MSDEFITPEFLTEETFDDIMERMLGRIPEDVDTSEGSHPFNLLAPTAFEKERMAQFVLAEAIKLIFPKYCDGYDDVADDHAETNGIKRKAAFYALGELTASGESGTIIPKGSVFSTIATDNTESIEFEAIISVEIGVDGTAAVPIQAVEPGSDGNVSAGTIILQDDVIEGVDEVINKAATSGGVDEESTASLINRIVEYDRTQGLSFVGNIADYKRWSEEVDGVGVATVIPPEDDDDSGLITIVLTDSLGSPATTALCQSVYNYMVRPDDPESRLVPINGANINVVPPVTVNIRISARIEVMDITSLNVVKSEFLKNMTAYLANVPNEKEIKYSKVGAILSNTYGVDDYEGLEVNDGTANIPIGNNEFPKVTDETVSFTELERA